MLGHVRQPHHICFLRGKFLGYGKLVTRSLKIELNFRKYQPPKIRIKGPVTLQFSEQFVLQCHGETSCWRIAQFTVVVSQFLLCVALHEGKLSPSFHNKLQQLATALHNVSSLQLLCTQFSCLVHTSIVIVSSIYSLSITFIT